MRSGIVNEGFEKLQVKLLHNLCPIDLSTGVCWPVERSFHITSGCLCTPEVPCCYVITTYASKH